MDRKTFTCLFLCSLVIWTSGNGLLPLLPVYAKSLGATATQTGLYLAFSYSCLALGVMAAGALLKRLTARSLLIKTGLLGLPITLAVGWVDSIISLVVLTSLLWCFGGMGFTALNSIAANRIETKARGRLFTLLGITSPLGSIVGGLFSGPIVDSWGYGMLFILLALFSLLWPLSAVLIEERPSSAKSPQPASRDKRLSSSALLLLLASTVAYMANFMAVLGMSLVMNDQGHSAAAITSTAAVGGVAAIPLIYGLGILSDRFGRKRCWLVCVAAGLCGLLLLGYAQVLFQFWLVALLLRVLTAGNRGIGSAWMVDLVTAASRVKAISLFGATTWFGGIAGYLVSGYGLQHWGSQLTLMVAVFTLVVAITLVVPLKYPQLTSKQEETVSET